MLAAIDIGGTFTDVQVLEERGRRLGVIERTAFDGRLLTPLDEAGPRVARAYRRRLTQRMCAIDSTGSNGRPQHPA